MSTTRSTIARRGFALALALACLAPASPAFAATQRPITIRVASVTKSVSAKTVKSLGKVKGTAYGVGYYGVPLWKVLAKAGYSMKSLHSIRVYDSYGNVVNLSGTVASNSTTLIGYARTSGGLPSSDFPYRLIVKGQPGKSLRHVTQVEANPFELDVSAASSLTNVFEKYAHVYEGKYNAHVVYNFGASGTLQKQIEAGVPIDVFASAAPKQVNALISEGLISSGSQKVFASNDLCILVPKGNPGGITKPSDLWTKANKVATGDPAVAPHGVAAREWLTNLGQWSNMLAAGKLVLAPNASITDAYISSANVDAGIGFKSDAFGRSDIKSVYVVPQSYYTQIQYVGAPIKGAKHPSLAGLYLKWIASSSFQTILKKNGFKAAP